MARRILITALLFFGVVVVHEQAKAQMPFAFLAARSPLAIQNLANPYNLNNLTTYTFSSANFGATSARRFILVGYMARSASTLIASSVSVGGISATILGQNQIGGTVTGFAIALVPTGASGDVVVTYSGSMVASGISVWSLTNLVSEASVSNGLVSNSATISIPKGGAAFAVNFNNSSVRTWSGVTSNSALGPFADGTEPNRTFSVGSLASANGISSLLIAVSGSDNSGGSYYLVLR
ncbi:MAG: hypothetical protein EOP06_26985 [Proteobacteria bacterium]|nr:MAG: hypothetical protein EOP06_26985 [Pseudomonadota bacterium]